MSNQANPFLVDKMFRRSLIDNFKDLKESEIPTMKPRNPNYNKLVAGLFPNREKASTILQNKTAWIDTTEADLVEEE